MSKLTEDQLDMLYNGQCWECEHGEFHEEPVYYEGEEVSRKLVCNDCGFEYESSYSNSQAEQDAFNGYLQGEIEIVQYNKDTFGY